MFVVRDLHKRVQAASLRKETVLSWLRQQAYQNNWELEPETNGVTVVVTVAKRKARSYLDENAEIQDGLALAKKQTRDDLHKAVTGLKMLLDERGLEYE